MKVVPQKTFRKSRTHNRWSNHMLDRINAIDTHCNWPTSLVWWPNFEVETAQKQLKKFQCLVWLHGDITNYYRRHYGNPNRTFKFDPSNQTRSILKCDSIEIRDTWNRTRTRLNKSANHPPTVGITGFIDKSLYNDKYDLTPCLHHRHWKQYKLDLRDK